MTLKDALDLVPEYIMLKVGTPIMAGDETLELAEGVSGHGDWIADTYPLGHGVGGFTEARRPIPQDVREDMAKLIMQGDINNPFEYWLLTKGGKQ